MGKAGTFPRQSPCHHAPASLTGVPWAWAASRSRSPPGRAELCFTSSLPSRILRDQGGKVGERPSLFCPFTAFLYILPAHSPAVKLLQTVLQTGYKVHPKFTSKSKSARNFRVLHKTVILMCCLPWSPPTLHHSLKCSLFSQYLNKMKSISEFLLQSGHSP